MSEIIIIAASVLVSLHGLVHIMGFYVYSKLGEIEGLPYKTTVLKGRVEFKEIGMTVFGIGWLLAGIGFVVGAVAFGTGHEWANALIRSITILSMVITCLDYSVAYMGIAVNIGILIGLHFL